MKVYRSVLTGEAEAREALEIAQSVFRDYKLYKVTLEEVREPRTWDNPGDVPADVAVADADGDRIFRSGNRYAFESDDGTFCHIGHPSSSGLFSSGPFTEILED